jgi:chitodextrinase
VRAGRSTYAYIVVKFDGLSWTAKVRTFNLARGSVSDTYTGTGSLTFARVSDQLPGWRFPRATERRPPAFR